VFNFAQGAMVLVAALAMARLSQWIPQWLGMDARAFEGNFLFSLGPNNEAGGNRTTACHIDIPLRHCTVSLDGRAVVRDGKVLDGGVGEYE
ncbi:hypothetical protein QWA_17410, partial [Alcaligenes faecalis subsp. faecalis NCIB 8687]